MPIPVKWNGDGLSPGTLTTSTVGPGDTALGAINGGANLTVNASGPTSPRIRMAAGMANIYAGWGSVNLGTISQYVASTFFEFETIGSALWAIASGNISGTVTQWRVEIAGTAATLPGNLRLRDGSTQLALSSQALSINTLYRLEVAANGSAITATVFVGTTNTVAAGPISGAASSGSVDSIRFGNFSSSTTSPVMYFDGLSVAPPPVSVTAAATGTGVAVDTGAGPPVVTAGTTALRTGTTYFVAVRNKELVRVGALTPTALTFTSRYNDVGEWSLVVPAASPNANALRQPGAGVLIYRNDDMAKPVMTGPVGSRVLSLTEDGLQLEVSGPDDNVWLAGRVAYQMPDRVATSQGTPTLGANSHDRRSGKAETVMKAYVRANAGGNALAVRECLTVAETRPVPLGNTVRGVARMTPLMDVLKGLAKTGGVGFGVTQLGENLVFDVYSPTDRTLTARFSTLLGNLDTFQLTETAPSTSYVVAGGQGNMQARVFLDMTDTAALVKWPGWRVEAYLDQRQAENTADGAAEIEQAMAEELVTNGPVVQLAMQTRDTAQIQFGRDFFVGDRVTVEPPAGVDLIQEVIREITVTWTAEDGVTAVSTVGSSEATGTPRMVKLLRRLTRRANAVNNAE